jgi:hypothetical protein
MIEIYGSEKREVIYGDLQKMIRPKELGAWGREREKDPM